MLLETPSTPTSVSQMLDKLLIIDSNALFHRSRAALSRAMGEMSTSFGIPTTGTYGFLNALFSIIEKHNFDSIIPVYDAGNNWRKKEDEDYKADREKSSIAHYADMNLLIEDVLPALGFTPVGVPGYEADDVIATIARKSPAYKEIYILTCDKDLLQLVNNRVKVILFNSAKKVQVVDIDGVVSIFGVYPSDVKYFKALAGDSSDNVAGLKGVGPKTAIKIIEECTPALEDEVGDFSGADRIAFHPRVRQDAGTFLANLRLVTLEKDVPDLVWFASTPPSLSVITALFEALEFRSYLKPARLSKIQKALRVDR
jgi:DNA polymerase-1